MRKHNGTITNTRRKNEYRDYEEICLKRKPHCLLSGTKTGKQSRHELKRINLITNIAMNNITELNNLINPGVKLVNEKVGYPCKSKNRKAKPGWETRTETKIRNI